jgi:transcriptional regulator with XRE-family HTH domain
VPHLVTLPDADDVRLREALAANVRRLRLEQGMTVEHAAARGPLDARHWQKIETASVNVSLKSLARLARALGVAEVELLASAAADD